MTKKEEEEVQKNTQIKNDDKVNIKESNVENESDIDTAQNIKKEVNEDERINKTNNVAYVGFWSRYAAFVIDSIVAGMVAIPFMFVAGFLSAIVKSIFNDSVLVNLFLNFLTYIIELGVLSIYFIFMTHKFQSTLGKMAVGVIVKKVSGETLSFKEVCIREFFKVAQIMFMSLPLVVVAFTQKKQGLHDLVVKSVVVCKDPQKGVNKWVVGLVIVSQIILFLLVVLVTFGLIMMFNSR